MAKKPISSSDFKNTDDEDEYDKKDINDKEDIEDDDSQDNYEKPKKGAKQIEINPSMRNVDESIEFLPEELQEDAIERFAKEMLTDIIETIKEASEATGYSFDVLFEVFKRGFEQNFDDLTKDYDYLDRAFDRVESFLNEGLAFEIDRDLLESDSGGLQGTDNLVQNYINATPGQKLITKIKDKKNG